MSAAAMMSTMLGIGLVSAFGRVGGLFIGGEVPTDPSGWQGVLLVSAAMDRAAHARQQLRGAH